MKTGKKKPNELGKVLHHDLYGKRDFKYDFLSKESLSTINFEKLNPEKPYLFFVPKDNKGLGIYQKGFSVEELFSKNITGIVTMGDNFIIEENKSILKDRLVTFLENNVEEDFLKTKYKLGKNYAKWIIENKKEIVFNDSKIKEIA